MPLSPTLEEFLPTWVAEQRWYRGKSGSTAPRLRRVASVRWEDPSGEVGLEDHVVVDESGVEPVVYQVPLSYRAEPVDSLEHALVAVAEHDELGTRYVYDAAHDPVFAEVLLQHVYDGKDVPSARARRVAADGGTAALRSCRVLGVEQSNTSVVVEPRDGTAPVILKIFRVLQPGENPDVSVGIAVGSSGNRLVPAPVGYVEGRWPLPDGTEARGHLVFAQEFLPDTQDAWRTAVDAARADEDFSERARALGAATATVHAVLRDAFPVRAADAGTAGTLVEQMRRRAESAFAEVPDLAAHRQDVESVYAALEQTGLPALQRIHGDYHLGQVLDVPDRGWVLLDFEGEPLRPLEERCAPDVALRDVAGMLRSFDYAAATVDREGGGDRSAWAQSARTAFLEGYAATSGADLQGPGSRRLIDALELDKALYEVVYEARNRPDWIDIPVGAVERLVAGAATGGAVDGGAGPAAAPADLGSAGADGVLDGPTPRHSPVLAPPEMFVAMGEVPPDEAAPDWPTPASGYVRYHGAPSTVAPEVARDTAWTEATSSPDVVTGEVVGSRVAAPGPRVLLDTPEVPVPPHTRPLDLEEATDVVHGLHRSPHDVLGAHVHEGHVTIRTVQPSAQAVAVLLPDGDEVPMTAETGGIWVAVLPQEEVPAYRLRVEEPGARRVVDEAYRHPTSLSEQDLDLLAAGRHEELWKVLGSHVMSFSDELGETTGTRFTVWAPNALAVHVIGDFNGWDGATSALRVHEPAGVWEIFVPGVGAGAHYKYDITGPDGTRRAKADPMARASEVPPFNNSVVTVSSHRWRDEEWMRRRAEADVHHGPMSIYEVHLGSWRPGLTYEELADELVEYVSEMGFTHVELMPVMQHPYGPSWGYHVTGYYAADSRFGHEDGLRYLVDRMHQAGVGVLLDWVPGHFATDPWALARFDGTPLYEHPDPRRGWHPEWGSYIFDFGRPQVRNFLVANATYWLEEFHADGLRVDGVASMLYLDYSRADGQWVPNRHGGRENLEAVELLRETNATAYRRSPGIVMIAEESTSWPGVTSDVHKGGLGFGFKWNMGWMHDTLGYLAQNPIARSRSHHALTFALVYAYSEKFILPISHDEVVHGKGSLVRKMSGDAWQKFATTRAFLAYQWSHPGKQLLFMGSEFAQSREWDDGGALQWELTERPGHSGVHRLVRDLNRLYGEHPALWQIDHHKDGFVWLDANDAARNTYAYLRWGNEDADGLRPVVAVLVNFSGVPQERVHVGLPYGGRWREVLNTDADVYDGSGVGNMGYVEAQEVEHQRQPFSALVTLPPLGAVWLVPDPEPEPELQTETEAEMEPEAATEVAAGATGGHPRAGQPAREEDLVDVEALLTAYAEVVPDPDDVDQQVAFGTSGHRGSSLDGAFNEHHILATTQAICDYRTAQGTDGPLFLGRDTHALSEPAWRSALEVLVANGVDVRVDSADGYTPTPAVSRAILQHNRETPDDGGVADGIVVTPSHNPPRDGGFKYNPPHGGPADTDATRWIADRANELLRRGLDGVRRVPFEQARSTATDYDFLGEYVRALPRVVDLDAIRRAGVRIGADPLGGAAVDYWQAIADTHGLDLTVVNPEVDPTWRFMTLDRDGKIRMDCSSPDAMASLIRTMQGEETFDVATGNDADADRHGIVTPDGGLMNPNHYLAVAIDYLYGGARPDWPADTAVGKTLVSSSMIDRVAQGLGRPLVEVPVGFKWFVPGLLDGSIAFGGEESAGASFLCRDGSVWTTDKDGLILALLAAEIIATTGRTPSQRYAELLARYAADGEVVYARLDAPADRAQKQRLATLSPTDVTATELAGEPITAVLTEAPGNGAPIGGLKVTTAGAWFAARPSGTEDVYKIYAESFSGPEHLAQVQAEAQQVVDAALGEG